MKTVAIVSARGGKSVITAEMEKLLDQVQAQLVEQGMATTEPYEIRLYDPSPAVCIQRRRKRKGRGRHKANRWSTQ